MLTKVQDSEGGREQQNYKFPTSNQSKTSEILTPEVRKKAGFFPSTQLSPRAQITEQKKGSRAKWTQERDTLKERLAIAMELNRDLKKNVAHLEYDRIHHQKSIE